jgi:hypothetical protein
MLFLWCPVERKNMMTYRKHLRHPSDTTGFSRVPIPSASNRTRSPGLRKICGSRNMPTPGCSRCDNIAWLQCHHVREERWQVGQWEQPIAGRTILQHCAVDICAQPHIRWVGQVVSCDDARDYRRAGVEVLAKSNLVMLRRLEQTLSHHGINIVITLR